MRDFVLHIIGAVAIVALLAALGLVAGHPVWNAWFGVIVASFFWFAREVAQGAVKYGRLVLPGDRDWSGTKTREGILPAFAAVLAAVLISFCWAVR